MRNLKKICRRLRARRQERISLINALINIRSYGGASGINRGTKKLLKNTSLAREYGILNRIIEDFGSTCFNPQTMRPRRGHRTYFVEGKYYPYDPIMDDLPF